MRPTAFFGLYPLRVNNFFAGKVVYANAAGIPMIFLNDFQANEDLINTGGDRYSDKPKMVMLNELCSGKYMASTHMYRYQQPSSRSSCHSLVRMMLNGSAHTAESWRRPSDLGPSPPTSHP